MKLRLIFVCVILVSFLSAQAPAPAPAVPSGGQQFVDQLRLTYILGPGDQVAIRAFEMEEINSVFRIDSDGDVSLPVVGKVHAGGLTVEQFEGELLTRLKVLIKNPQVTVNVTQYRSEPVFLEGAVKNPGIYPLQGRHTLREFLTSVGGLQPDASKRLVVTRHLEMGTIPLPNAVIDREKKIVTAEINLSQLRDAINPAEDIILQPMDTISVDKAELVYVSGEVNKVGGLEVGDRNSLSITQAVSMAGGLNRDAAPEKARILRPVFQTSKRAEIPVNIKRILAGKDTDLPLLPNDVLYVPKGGHRPGNLGLIAIPVATSFVYLIASKL